MICKLCGSFCDEAITTDGILCLKCYNKTKKTSKKEEQSKKEYTDKFMEYLSQQIDYWISAKDSTLRERMEGLIFSMFVAFDGESYLHPMDIITADGTVLDNTGTLHQQWCDFTRRNK